MTPPEHFLWHDYETFGTHPALDRPAQFGAIRTDSELRPVGDPLCWYCRPADDCLPHPMACLVTGITPQLAYEKGIPEAHFAQRIHQEMMRPGTCSVGYNSVRFDDEVSRNLFYRNFFDPYEREYRNGNSRWDLIDLVRMFYALRPSGIEWPARDDGTPGFRLEQLTQANDIPHSGAHDALADVRATIEMARRLRTANRRLFNWGLSLRDHGRALELLDLSNPAPLLLTSSLIPAERGCTTLVLPLCQVPRRPKSVVVFDLMSNPSAWLDLAAEDIAERVFTPAAELADDTERIPLITVHTNKVPMLAPRSVLQGADPERIGLDPARCEGHAQMILRRIRRLRPLISEVFSREFDPPDPDPDAQLYSGGFFSPRDRAAMNRIRSASPEQLARETWHFEDPRLPEMLFRYRARNFPESLDEREAQRWKLDRQARIGLYGSNSNLNLAAFRKALREARQAHAGEPAAGAILDQLAAWDEHLGLGS